MPIPEAVTAGITAATKDEIKGFVSGIFSSLGRGFKNLINEAKVDVETAFTEYLLQSQERYGMVKTLLYGDDPKWIYSIYEHNYLMKPIPFHSPERAKGEGLVQTKRLTVVLDISRFLIITGTGGCGKSMMMRHFFMDALLRDGEAIPIFVELRELTRDTTLLDVMYQSMTRLGFSLDLKYFKYALQEGKFMILLDAYDEIPDNKDGHAYKEITRFCDTYNRNIFIMSTRPYESFVQWGRFTVRSVSPLNKKQACSLIKKLEYDKDIKKRFLQELQDTLFDRHQTFTSIPLLLNIMLLTYEYYAEIPEKVHLFYDNAFHTLFNRHDARKGAYKRERKSSLSSDDFQKILSEFCCRSYINDQLTFTRANLLELLAAPCKALNANAEDFLDDLCLNVCILKIDGYDNYTFTHRSFQEYFTAVYLKSVPDDMQTKAGIWLIEKRKFVEESFRILLDIDMERVEQTILVPSLDKFFSLIESKGMRPATQMIVHSYDRIYIDSSGKNDRLVYVDRGQVKTCREKRNCFVDFSRMIFDLRLKNTSYWTRFETAERVYRDEIIHHLRNGSYIDVNKKKRHEGSVDYEEFIKDKLLVEYFETHSPEAYIYRDLKMYYQFLLEKHQKQKDELGALFV